MRLYLQFHMHAMEQICSNRLKHQCRAVVTLHTEDWLRSQTQWVFSLFGVEPFTEGTIHCISRYPHTSLSLPYPLFLLILAQSHHKMTSLLIPSSWVVNSIQILLVQIHSPFLRNDLQIADSQTLRPNPRKTQWHLTSSRYSNSVSWDWWEEHR